MRHIQGMVKVEILSADTAAATKAIMAQGISLYDAVTRDDLRIVCRIQYQDFQKLEKICQSRGDSLTVRGKTGLIWPLKALMKRPVLVLGAMFLVCLAIFLSTRVLFVRVEGNISIPDRKIMESAEAAGVYFGASRRALRSEQVKNILLEAMPELKWACLNTYGSVAKITVRERSEVEKSQKNTLPGSIVACRDGIVISCTATKGTLVCEPGQAVTKGQVLISGYTDCGIFIRTDQAEGEVFGQTLRPFQAILLAEYIKITRIAEEKKNYSLLLGKKRINLWQSSGIPDTLCDRMYEEYYVTLPGGFQLPLALAVDTIAVCNGSPEIMSPEEAESLLILFSENYLRSQMIAGEIMSSDTELKTYDGCFGLEGQFVCSEMIGRMQIEEIGDYHGESN